MNAGRKEGKKEGGKETINAEGDGEKERINDTMKACARQ